MKKWTTLSNKKWLILRTIIFILLSGLCVIIFSTNGELQIKADVDGAFHFSRILSLETIGKTPINFWYFNHVGNPVDLFYPWLAVYPMYLIYLLCHNLVLSYYLYFIILSYLTLEIVYQCAVQFKQRRSIAVMVAVIYTFALCRTSNIYYRMAVGESIAMTFLPLVVLGIVQIFYQSKPRWKVLTVGMTLLVYTHAISLVMAAVMVFIFFVMAVIRRTLTKERFLALVKATVMTIFLSLGYFIPMFQVMSTTKIAPPMVYQLMESAIKIPDLLTQSLANNVGAYDTLGIVYLVMIGFLIWGYRYLDRMNRDFMIVGSLFLFISTTLFPWDIFQSTLTIIQFPWRFLVLAMILLTFSFGYLIMHFPKPINQLKVSGIIIGLVLVIHLAALGTVRHINGVTEGLTQEHYLTALKENTSFNGESDYIPEAGKADYGRFKLQQAKINGQWQSISTVARPTEISFSLYSNKAGKAILPVYHYVGETVTRDGKTVEATASSNGATEVDVKKGWNRYTIRYHYTPLMKVSYLLSVISLIIFIIFLLERQKKQ